MTDISPEAIDARAAQLDHCAPSRMSIDAAIMRAQAERTTKLELEIFRAHSLIVACANERADLHRKLSTARADALREAARVYRTGEDWDVFATADCAILDLIEKETT